VIDITGARLAGALPSLKDGVSVASLTDALAAHGERLQKLVESVDFSGAGRAFAALNTACLEQALVVHVAAGVDAGRLLLRWTPAAGSDAVLANFRILLLLDQGARLQLLQQFGGADGAAQGLNVLVQAQLDREASLEEIRLQSEADASTLLTATGVEQAEASRYRYLGFDLGGGLVRHEFDIALAGPAALADLAGAFVLDGRRYVDNHISVDHTAADCRSEQFFRGVLGGRSRGVFNGRALIRPGADGSVVHQSNANLLLSGLAEMDTKPELEIYADEVEASHGATVGQLDESAVFYLRTRGLSDAQARRMLTAAFCRAVTDRLADRELAEQVGALLDAAMPEADERPGSG
jgi:Fe-S cluster assembly protein SufD